MHTTDPPNHRPVWAQIDLQSIRDNVRVLRRHAAGAELMAVVKANGYGHGAVPVARTALEAGATWLGVAMIEEGLELRQAGIDAPVLVLSEPPPEAAGALLSAGLTATVYTQRFAEALDEAARDRAAGDGAARDRAARVHVKLDTGMHRVGAPEEQWGTLLTAIASLPDVHVEGLWSHLAVGDEPDNDFTVIQQERFARGVGMARDVGLDPQILHLANSAGTTVFPSTHQDLVRTGIALYGLEAAPGIALEGLRPALSLRSRLSLVKPLARGESVSYGRRWTAEQDTVIGTVVGGYADGIRRGLTNIGAVWINGRRCRVAGAVCMDQFVVDLGPDATEQAGEDVWLIGGPGPDAVTAADWAAWLDTITYEVTCGIGSRVPRVHLNT